MGLIIITLIVMAEASVVGNICPRPLDIFSHAFNDAIHGGILPLR